MDQYEQIQIYNKKFFWGIATKFFSAVMVLSILAAVIGLTWYYRDLGDRKIDSEEAKKIGNWEFPDDYYVFQSAFKLNMFNDTAKNVEILDQKSGNEISILAMSREFSEAHLKFDLAKADDEKSNDELFMEYYVPDRYAIRGTGKIEDGKAEVSYNLIENKGYENLDEKNSGLLGRIICTDDVIVILVTNKAGQFSRERALDFAKTLSCEGTVSDLKAEERNENIAAGEENGVIDPQIQTGGDDPEDGSVTSTASIIENKIEEVAQEVPEDLPALPLSDAETSETGDQEITNNEAGNIVFEDNDDDGLSNNVEFVVSSDPNEADTDSDGFSDFDEIRYGHNPQIPSPGDELPPNYYIRIREQIKIIDEENYKKIFQ